MRKSRVNPAYYFNEDQWVISVLNWSGDASIIEEKVFGHAVLLVEGLKTGPQLTSELFVGQYDIRALPTEEPRTLETLRNTTGIISSVRTFEATDYVHPKADEFYQQSQSKSFTVPRTQAQEMIKSIEVDKAYTERAQRGEVDYLPFQKFGSQGGPLQSLLSDKEAGLNCAEWCMRKMELAGIHLEGKPKPERVAGGCIIF